MCWYSEGSKPEEEGIVGRQEGFLTAVLTGFILSNINTACSIICIKINNTGSSTHLWSSCIEVPAGFTPVFGDVPHFCAIIICIKMYRDFINKT